MIDDPGTAIRAEQHFLDMTFKQWREVIEVATFRAASAPPPSEEPVPSREEDEAELLEEEGDGGEVDPLEATSPLDTTQPLEVPAFGDVVRGAMGEALPPTCCQDRPSS